MVKKKILYNQDARNALKKGMEIVAKVVSLTLGPKGKNVVLDGKFGAPKIVNDGITIAQEIELNNPFENTGVALIRQSTAKTNDVAGDGTTTATVLAYGIVREGLKCLSLGHNPILIRIGLEKAARFIINKISEYSRPVSNLDDIVNIAAISAGNNMNVGFLIAKAIKQVGKEGIITLEEGETTKTLLEFTEGMELDKGFISPYFVRDNTDKYIVQDNPLILLVNRKIISISADLISILEQVATLKRSLLIIAEDIEKEALAVLILNKLKGIIDVVAVRAPGFGDRTKTLLDDIAFLTGGTVISPEIDLTLDKLEISMMGSARQVVIFKDKTKIITDTDKQSVQVRCNQIRKQIQATSNDYEKEKLQERLSKLSGSVAIIKVGAATESEMKEKKLRFEDAINATKSAVEEGIVPGGGATLFHLSLELSVWAREFLCSGELIGANILVQALSMPLVTIIDNAGMNASVIINQMKKNDFAIGYDASKNMIVDMYSSGIIDPAKVTRSAIQNALSIGSMILTTECIVSY